MLCVSFLLCPFLLLSLLHILIFSFEFPIPRHEALAPGGSWWVNLYLQLGMVLFMVRADTCLRVSLVNIVRTSPQLPCWLKTALIYLCLESVDKQAQWTRNKSCLSTSLCARHAFKLLITVTYWTHHLFIELSRIIMHTARRNNSATVLAYYWFCIKHRLNTCCDPISNSNKASNK